MLKKALRFFRLLIFIIFASCGLGIGSVLSGSKERYRDNEIKIEQTDKRDEDDEEPDEDKS